MIMETWTAMDYATVIVASGSALALGLMGAGWFVYLCHRGPRDPHGAAGAGAPNEARAGPPGTWTWTYAKERPRRAGSARTKPRRWRRRREEERR